MRSARGSHTDAEPPILSTAFSLLFVVVAIAAPSIAPPGVVGGHVEVYLTCGAENTNPPASPVNPSNPPSSNSHYNDSPNPSSSKYAAAGLAPDYSADLPLSPDATRPS